VAKSPQGKEPDWWPRDPFGYLFLARVVEKIGAALHSGWTGTEAETITHDRGQLPRDLKDATPFNKRQAEDLLSHYRPDLGRPSVLGGWRKFSDKDWEIAYDLLRDQVTPALRRLHKTLSEIVKRNETGELELRIQSRNAGPWRDFNKDWWNTDQWRSHFVRCRIDPDYPKGDRPSWMRDDNDHWIFATLQSAGEVLKQFNQPGGRSAGFDWQTIEIEAIRLMNVYGDFAPNKPKWNAQARLEDKLLEFCQIKWGREPSSSRLRSEKYLPSWLTRWRNEKRDH
jgi:hypothetical protein